MINLYILFTFILEYHQLFIMYISLLFFNSFNKFYTKEKEQNRNYKITTLAP